MNNIFPHELQIGDIYLTPILPVLFISFFASVITVLILNKAGIAKWFFKPQYVFLAIMVLYVLLIDKFLIRF
jgi:hypothetical protein